MSSQNIFQKCRELCRIVIKNILNPGMFLVYLDNLGLIRMKDEQYLQILFRRRFNKWANLKDPKTFQEKLLYLKLWNRNPNYTKMADKDKVREYVAEKIGEQYLIPTIGIYNHVDEINFETLPNQFVIQCTHDSSGIILCKDKSKLDIADVKKKLNTDLKENYYYKSREWVYKNIKPRIIIKKYMVDESSTELKDYKIFCFHGIPKIIEVAFNRFHDLKCNFYDTNWNFIDMTMKYPNDKNKEIKRPESLAEMLEISRILSKNIPFLRVDLYDVCGKVYFGELTFFPAAGYADIHPKEYERKLGDWLQLNFLNG